MLRELGTKPPEPPPAADLPTPELIALLSGPMGGSLAARCTDAILADLRDVNRAKSFGPVYKLCSEVVEGNRDPDSLSVPLVRTLDEIAKGKAIPNPGGYWTRGVQNWGREKG